MLSRRRFRVAVCFAVVCVFAQVASAAPPWGNLMPFRRVDADARKEYSLKDTHGPWLIYTASFAGPDAERQARELVQELRSTLKLSAYVYRQRFDFTSSLTGLGFEHNPNDPKDPKPMKMKYANAVEFDEFAVLVGDFESLDDGQLQKALQKIKYARPKCLSIDPQKGSNQRFVGLRDMQRKMNSDEDKRRKGPMGNAFATRNPILPNEYFAPKGPDKFVLEMNRDVKYSLLKNKGRYTVRVATFRGMNSLDINGESDEWKRSGKVTNKLELAAERANVLTTALREKNVEAYEFHDRHESIVTIGSFDTLGEQQATGQFVFNPAVAAILTKYSAKRKQLPDHKEETFIPYVIKSIPFDVEPMPIEVPRRSVSAELSRRN